MLWGCIERWASTWFFSSGGDHCQSGDSSGDPSTFRGEDPVVKFPGVIGCWLPCGGFLKCWYPTTMGCPTKNDHFGVFWGYHHLRKHPCTRLSNRLKHRWIVGLVLLTWPSRPFTPCYCSMWVWPLRRKRRRCFRRRIRKQPWENWNLKVFLRHGFLCDFAEVGIETN